MSQEFVALRWKGVGGLLVLLLLTFAAHGGGNQSDLNRDGVVDLEDLKIFSVKVAGQNWQTIAWCQWVADHPEYEKRYGDLYAFIRSYFACGDPPPPPPPPPPADPLALVNKLGYPTRLTWDAAGKLYVTDARVGSVFIYSADLVLSGELKGLNKPLGVLVDAEGRIYVGNNGRDNVEIYSAQGSKLAVWGEGELAMPNSLARDRLGNLYVADSANNRVVVFNATGGWVRSLGEPELAFPAAVTVHYRLDSATGQEVGEIYVADQKNYFVRVYDLQGALVRSLGGQGTTGGMMGNKFYWQGKFVRVSGLAFAPDGNLHAVDCYYNNAQILNPLTGVYVGHYGAPGTAPGQLRVPLDIAINAQGFRALANTLNGRIELFQP